MDYPLGNNVRRQESLGLLEAFEGFVGVINVDTDSPLTQMIMEAMVQIWQFLASSLLSFLIFFHYGIFSL